MIFVTGAAGFVGKALVQRILRGHQQVVVGVRTASDSPRPDGVQTRLIGDLGRDSLDALDLRGITTLVHCAGRAHIMRDRETNPLSAYRQVNVEGTLALAKRAVACGVKRFVFISSVKVNGEVTSEGHVFRADDTPDPQDSYGLSKLEAEQALHALAGVTGMELVIIRPPLVYGPGVRANFGAMVRWVRSGWPLPLGAVHNRRSLVGLDNLTDFILACCQHIDAANQTFLVSDGCDVSISQLLRLMAAATEQKIALLNVPVWSLRLGATLLGKSDAVARLCGNLQVDIKKNQELLGWRPVVSLEEGLRGAMLEQAKA